MHAVILTRGLKMYVDSFFNKLQGISLPFPVLGTKNPMKMPAGWGSVEVMVKPIQLWDISFPKECKDLMLHTLLDNGGAPMNDYVKKYMALLRYGMKLQPIPEYNKAAFLPIKNVRAHTEFIGIGIKEDGTFEDGTEAL